MHFASALEGQQIEIHSDRGFIDKISISSAGEQLRKAYYFPGKAGVNQLVFEFSCWNHGPGSTFAPADPRKLAVDFFRLRVVPNSLHAGDANY
jgi:hypothetical protein